MDKRDLLLEATLRIVLREGYANFQMKKLSTEAGVAIGTIYLYFINKKQLLLSLYENISKRLTDFVLQGYAANNDLKTSLQRMTQNLLEFYTTRPDCFSFLQQYSLSPIMDVQQLKRQHAVFLEPIYSTIVAAKCQRLVKDLPETLLIALIAGPINSFMTTILNGYVDAKDEVMRHQLQEACWQSVAR